MPHPVSFNQNVSPQFGGVSLLMYGVNKHGRLRQPQTGDDVDLKTSAPYHLASKTAIQVALGNTPPPGVLHITRTSWERFLGLVKTMAPLEAAQRAHQQRSQFTPTTDTVTFFLTDDDFAGINGSLKPK